jgi:hypothetical protein
MPTDRAIAILRQAQEAGTSEGILPGQQSIVCLFAITYAKQIKNWERGMAEEGRVGALEDGQKKALRDEIGIQSLTFRFS